MKPWAIKNHEQHLAKKAKKAIETIIKMDADFARNIVLNDEKKRIKSWIEWHKKQNIVNKPK